MVYLILRVAETDELQEVDDIEIVITGQLKLHIESRLKIPFGKQILVHGGRLYLGNAININELEGEMQVHTKISSRMVEFVVRHINSKADYGVKSIWINSTKPVSGLKRKIEEELGIPLSCQKLYIMENEMKDGLLLDEYIIREKPEVTVIDGGDLLDV